MHLSCPMWLALTGFVLIASLGFRVNVLKPTRPWL